MLFRSGKTTDRAPFREPVITADPRVLRLRQQVESQPQASGTLPATASQAKREFPAAPELPAPASSSTGASIKASMPAAGEAAEPPEGNPTAETAGTGAAATTAAETAVVSSPAAGSQTPNGDNRAGSEPATNHTSATRAVPMPPPIPAASGLPSVITQP